MGIASGSSSRQSAPVSAGSLQGDTLTVFLRDRFLARPVSMKSAPTAALLQFDPLPELDYILRWDNQCVRFHQTG